MLGQMLEIGFLIAGLVNLPMAKHVFVHLLNILTDSQLMAFADYHHIPVPHPRKRDSLLQKVRSSYDSIAKKAGETAAYPGNWLYGTWSESGTLLRWQYACIFTQANVFTDLKEFLDTHGIPAPQPSTRDKLIASVRRNARVASLKTADLQASASASAAAATETLSEQLLSAWSDSRKFGIFFSNDQLINSL